jgi:RNA polymerase sigma factor (sigma-70 family)
VELLDCLAAKQRTPSREVSVKEATHAVRIALSSLPEKRRQAIWMRHIEGKSLAEIAQAMRKTNPAVNSLLFNGLRQLRRRLGCADRFFSDSPGDGTPPAP